MNKNVNNFSVSISVYINDNPKHFYEALKSIVNQTLIPSELILVVDGPIGTETNKVINRFEKECSFLKVIKLKKNLGHGNARRVGLSNCTNNIVALMDSDDISVSNRFELQFNFMLKNPQVSLVGGQIEEFEGSINNIISKREVPETDIQIKEYLKYRCPINQMTVMFRKDKVLEAGGYLDWFCNEDYYLWIRMILNNNRFYNLRETLVKFRVDINMYKRRGGLKYFKSEFEIQKLMKKKGLITFYRFSLNIIIRFIIQILMPPEIRKIIFLKFARK
jgi:glycosyltransferase involved in cell wall biosynthesis